jgi:hypothetical protein
MGDDFRIARNPPTNGEDSPAFPTREERSPRKPILGASRTGTTKARDTDSAVVGPNPGLNGDAKKAIATAVIFEILWETARGWPASNDDKWHRSDAATVSE